MNRQQHTVHEEKIDREVEKEKTTGLINQFGGMLVAFSAFAGLVGFQMEWLTEEVVNSLVVFLYAAAGFGYTAYTIYKNHFSGPKAKQQNKVLKKEGLK